MAQDPIGREPLRILPKVIEAHCFNHVRLALNRLGKPLRFPLPGHRGLEMILDDHLWLCVDSVQGDMPILAFNAFNTTERDGLHQSVHCELCLCHVHAGLIMSTALEKMDQALAERLAYRDSARAGD
jgi:hypothetical protein